MKNDFVICKCHKSKIFKHGAFVVKKGLRNFYYCNQREYEKVIQSKKSKDNIYKMTCEIFGYKIKTSIFFKELTEISKLYSYQKIQSYIQFNFNWLDKILSSEFVSEYAKIRYYFTVLLDQMKKFEEAKEPIVKLKIFDEQIINRFSARKRKNSLNYYF